MMFGKVILFFALCLGIPGLAGGAVAGVPAVFAKGIELRAAPPCDRFSGREPGTSSLIFSASSEKDFKEREDEDLERAFEDLIEELKRLEKDVKDKVRKDLLPHLKREIEKLRKWLKEFQLDEEPQDPVKT